MPNHLFISGVPATGKTWLGAWLADEKGYVHIDAEKNGGADFDREGLHGAWDNLIRTGSADELLRAMNHLKKVTVLNWGMPMSTLFVVTALQKQGVEAWWINGDAVLARNAFIARENKKPQKDRISVRSFDGQMREIARYLSLVERVKVIFSRYPAEENSAETLTQLVGSAAPILMEGCMSF
jgi:hypothetical protein